LRRFQRNHDMMGCYVCFIVFCRSHCCHTCNKVTIPCKKEAYRLYGVEGYALVDIMKGEDEPAPKVC
jgi:hypothetical protein